MSETFLSRVIIIIFSKVFIKLQIGNMHQIKRKKRCSSTLKITKPTVFGSVVVKWLKKTYLIKAEASINHAFIVMSETFLTWVTIVILPASFTPIFGIDLIIILPWVTNVLKSKKVLLVCCLVYSFKSAFGFVTIS